MLESKVLSRAPGMRSEWLGGKWLSTDNDELPVGR